MSKFYKSIKFTSRPFQEKKLLQKSSNSHSLASFSKWWYFSWVMWSDSLWKTKWKIQLFNLLSSCASISANNVSFSTLFFLLNSLWSTLNFQAYFQHQMYVSGRQNTWNRPQLNNSANLQCKINQVTIEREPKSKIGHCQALAHDVGYILPNFRCLIAVPLVAKNIFVKFFTFSAFFAKIRKLWNFKWCFPKSFSQKMLPTDWSFCDKCFVQILNIFTT